MELETPVRAVCFDWGGTLMVDDGPDGVPMCRWPEVASLPGSHECLAALHGRVPLCIATNAAQSGRAMIEAALERVGLLRFFAEIFCLAEIGHEKDRPEFWRAVQDRLDLPVGQIVMVGDSLEHDVLAPRRVGLQAVWLNPTGAAAELRAAVPVVTDLWEASGLILRALS
jgi:FMN phosphatase YigB (HAD superfamily)